MVSIATEKVIEILSLSETRLSLSVGKIEKTVRSVVVVLSVLLEPSSLLLLQEMKVKIKRIMEMRMSRRCFTWFPISGLGERKI